MIRRLILLAGLVPGAIATTTAAQAAEPPPIAISVAWAGEPCNEAGLVEVTVANVSEREVAVQDKAYVGFGGSFIGFTRVRGGKPVMSDNMLPPQPPPPPPTDGSNEVRYPVRRLAPGESTSWPAQVGTTDTMFLGSPHFALETAYAITRAKGGETWLVYALSHAPDAFAPYVVASLKDGPLIESNHLSCPG